MLEICISSYLIVSITVSLLLWRALAAAKRADGKLKSADHVCLIESAEEGIPLRKLIPSQLPDGGSAK